MQTGSHVHTERQKKQGDEKLLPIGVFFTKIGVFAFNSCYDIIFRFHSRPLFDQSLLPKSASTLNRKRRK